MHLLLVLVSSASIKTFLIVSLLAARPEIDHSGLSYALVPLQGIRCVFAVERVVPEACGRPWSDRPLDPDTNRPYSGYTCSHCCHEDPGKELAQLYYLAWHSKSPPCFG